MLTQNSFNKKQKAYDPFASNVKLVGDDITEKDYTDFFEGFNDPYGEKREQARKEKFANIRANADNRNLYSQSTYSSQTTPFLNGVNGISNEREQRVEFPNTRLYSAPSNTNLMLPNTQLQAKPKNAILNSPNTQLQTSANNNASFVRFNNSYGEKKTIGEGLKEFASETIYEPIQDIGAHVSLHNTAHKQYPWMRFAGLTSPIVAGAIENRITSSSAKVSKHKDIINDVANRYNVPSEIIGAIIFKEQLTKSLPDTLATADAFIRKEKHSTGLGAIRAKTARDAWSWVNSQKELPKTDAELQYKLTYDKKFNIETIAAVLLYEAKNSGAISSDISEASNLTTERWWKAVAKYNGSDEYARKVYEYLPFTTELLD